MRWLRFPRSLGVVLVLYFLLVTAYFGYQATQRSAFLANAASAPGVVVALEPRPIPGSTRTLTGAGGQVAPRVRYVVDGKTYLYTATHPTFGSPVAVGDRIAVLYDPAAPARARLPGEGRVLVPLITAAFGTTTIVGVVILIGTRNAGARRGGAPDPGAAVHATEPRPA